MDRTVCIGCYYYEIDGIYKCDLNPYVHKEPCPCIKCLVKGMCDNVSSETCDLINDYIEKHDRVYIKGAL